MVLPLNHYDWDEEMDEYDTLIHHESIHDNKRSN